MLKTYGRILLRVIDAPPVNSAMAQGTNHGLPRKLASSNKSTRDKAVSLLVLWLSSQKEIGEEELRKIWKGLFYCVWHADKAPVQAELIDRLAGVLESVDVNLSVSFFEVFLLTMRKEWGGIDRLRLDKFYLLLRKFLLHMFKVLDMGGWDKKLVTKFMNALEERAFLAGDRYHALGVNLHIVDTFLEEFRKFLPVPDGTLGLLLEPFYAMLTTSSDKVLLRRIRENIFNPLLLDGRSLVTEIEREESRDVIAGNLGYLLPSTPVAPRLFDLASSPSTAQANRKVLYELNDEFSKLANVLDLLRGKIVQLKENGVSELNGRSGENSAEDLNHNSRTRLRKRQARVAALGVRFPFGAFKVKKPKKAKKEPRPFNDSSQDVHKEALENQEKPNSQSHRKEKDGQKRVKKQKRSSEDSFIALNKDLSVSQERVIDRKVKKAKRGQTAKRGGGEDSQHELDTDRIEREFDTNGYLDNCSQHTAVNSSCAETGQLDINEVTMNLAKKFDFVAVEGLGGSLTTSSTVCGGTLGPFRETRSEKKRKSEKNTSTIQSGTENGSGASPPRSPRQPPAKGGIDEQNPCESLKKTKKVRFALRNNLVCKPHGPLPPLSVRTPPSATPRGSALKSGVLPGPIRTRPIRIARGSGLVRSKKRASRQLLTILLQKPKSSARRLRNRKSL